MVEHQYLLCFCNWWPNNIVVASDMVNRRDYNHLTSDIFRSFWLMSDHLQTIPTMQCATKLNKNMAVGRCRLIISDGKSFGVPSSIGTCMIYGF